MEILDSFETFHFDYLSVALTAGDIGITEGHGEFKSVGNSIDFGEVRNCH